jgi:hypothetical protein
MFGTSADPGVRQTCVPSPLRPMPEIQEPYSDRYDHRRNHMLSSRSQVGLSKSPSLQAQPRQYHQASKEDYTHTHFEEPDAVSTTRFAPQSMEVAPVYLSAREPSEGGAITSDYHITETQFGHSATPQLENYLSSMLQSFEVPIIAQMSNSATSSKQCQGSSLDFSFQSPITSIP